LQLDTLHHAETPEGIALALRPAGLVARGQAWLIDLAIRLGIFVSASLVLGPLGGLGTGFLLVAYFLLEWGYPIAFELSRAGATPGKRALGLQVVMESGLPVTPGASVVRNLLRAADFLPFLYGAGAACMLLRSDFRRLGDLAAGTLVVHADRVRLDGALPPAEPVAPARALTQAEQAVIVEWAARAPRLTPARFEELGQIARSVTGEPATAEPAQVTRRLLGVAHWLLGHRAASP
jgi:uncharacterized RDD family membrane protein YckC